MVGTKIGTYEKAQSSELLRVIRINCCTDGSLRTIISMKGETARCDRGSLAGGDNLRTLDRFGNAVKKKGSFP